MGALPLRGGRGGGGVRRSREGTSLAEEKMNCLNFRIFLNVVIDAIVAHSYQ